MTEGRGWKYDCFPTEGARNLASSTPDLQTLLLAHVRRNRSPRRIAIVGRRPVTSRGRVRGRGVKGSVGKVGNDAHSRESGLKLETRFAS
jgi:hypothetical protein